MHTLHCTPKEEFKGMSVMSMVPSACKFMELWLLYYQWKTVHLGGLAGVLTDGNTACRVVGFSMKQQHRLEVLWEKKEV